MTTLSSWRGGRLLVAATHQFSLTMSVRGSALNGPTAKPRQKMPPGDNGQTLTFATHRRRLCSDPPPTAPPPPARFGVLAGTSLGVAGAVFLLAPRGLRSRLGRGRTTVKRQRGGFVKLKI